MEPIVGTAGWSIPIAQARHFPSDGTSLQRYASRFHGVEINSSFHRSHRPATWRRWAETVPPAFRFAVKLPKTITHQHKLADCSGLLNAFLDEAGALGEKLAILLVQLPPKLGFDRTVAGAFLAHLASRTGARIACEPRHPSWFDPEADRLLDGLEVARVAADPAVVPAAAAPGGWRGLSYWRLHGSPAIYRSAYGADRLERYATLLREEARNGRPAWCMFDNTASSAATGDAIALTERL